MTLYGGRCGYYANSAWGYHECTQPQLYQCQPNLKLGWYR